MPPTANSRHVFCSALKDKAGRLFLSDRVPFRYQPLYDNQFHVVSQGETLFSLAALYYDGMERAAGYWWVIADFQPDPINDPTVELTPGRTLVIPSARALKEEVFNEARRREHTA